MSITKSVVSGTIDFACIALCADTIGETSSTTTIVNTIQEIGTAIRYHEKTIAALSSAIDRKIEEFPNLSTEEKAALLTNITFNTVTAVMTGGGAAVATAESIANLTKSLQLIGIAGESMSIASLRQSKAILSGLSRLNLTIADAEAVVGAYG